jgi:hypothetical protein
MIEHMALLQLLLTIHLFSLQHAVDKAVVLDCLFWLLTVPCVM